MLQFPAAPVGGIKRHRRRLHDGATGGWAMPLPQGLVA